jgi:hypothetical protein
MRYLITALLVLVLATPAFALDLQPTEAELTAANRNWMDGRINEEGVTAANTARGWRERFILATDENVRLNAENDKLRADLDHKKKGTKFFLTVLGMFIWYDLHRGDGGGDGGGHGGGHHPKPKPKPCLTW